MAMVESIGGSMNAKIIGTGDGVLVLAHGYGGDQSVWDKVAPTLAEKFRVVTFDWKFSGAVDEKVQGSFDTMKYGSYDGYADDLIELMDEMSINSCIFVGHSMAGMIGCIASIKRPLLFKKLFLIATSPRFVNSEDYEGGFEASEIEQLLATMESNYLTWASTFAPLAVGAKDQNATEKFDKSLQKMRPTIALLVAKTVFLGDYRRVLEQVNTPCTLIYTTNDIEVPTSVPYYMQKKMAKSKSTVEIIDVDGHLPHMTAPDHLLGVLARSLDS